MTHEDPDFSHTEHPDGPEHSDSLPDAAAVPVSENPEDSFAPLLTEDIVIRPSVQNFPSGAG